MRKTSALSRLCIPLCGAGAGTGSVCSLAGTEFRSRWGIDRLSTSIRSTSTSASAKFNRRMAHVGGIFIAVSSGLPIPEALILYRGRAYSIITDGTLLLRYAVPWEKTGSSKANPNPRDRLLPRFFFGGICAGHTGGIEFCGSAQRGRTWSTSSGCTHN